ncbi:hypothetical protein CXB51_033810 [Gossypium anomalum]|uniref:Uncharacterized protein n=1 Tax=Gossypium anomalum TaxID=47600 RepID=A0A8J6CKH1_9ROSI|nr:hypothetical protein CXB51_033810 [Gossypium anomalum]
MKGSSTTYPPMLESGNYPYRKVGNPPMVEAVATKVPKSELKWTIEEERVANSNFKTLYVIFCGVDLQEFKRISKCTMVKEAWDILQTIHERTNTIKQSKMQMLTTKF